MLPKSRKGKPFAYSKSSTISPNWNKRIHLKNRSKIEKQLTNYNSHNLVQTNKIWHLQSQDKSMHIQPHNKDIKVLDLPLGWQNTTIQLWWINSPLKKSFIRVKMIVQYDTIA